MRNSATRLSPATKLAAAARPIFRPQPVAYAVMLACCGPVWANPSGMKVIQGHVPPPQGVGTSHLKITNSPGSIIHWQGFSIRAGEITQFIQESAASAVLNRVVGTDISRIHGQLLSNGRVFLINPAGILIGAGAVIDTAGFVGSTLRMQDADFIAGKLKFEPNANGSSGSITNHGWIKAGAGGNIVLVAPSIENSGIIQSEGGQIVLAAGRKMTIGSLDLEGLQFEIQAPADSVLNVGKLLADGGAVGAFAGTLRHSGDIRANALTRDAAGGVVLQGQSVSLAAGSSVSASGKTGGSIEVSGAVVIQSGDLRADGERGGSVKVQAGNLLQSGVISADGSAGAGGKISVWARNIIQTFSSLLSARGEGGPGGSVTVTAGEGAREGVFSSGALTATGSAGSAGGHVQVTGNEIVLRGARLDASGDTGGGSVLVGGDFQGRNPAVPNAQRTSINSTSSIKADAVNSGDGGKIIVWSDMRTAAGGRMSARGGAQRGDGGFIEVSGKETLVFGALADAGAPNGKPGTLLLDPKNILIDSVGGGGAVGLLDLVDPNIGAGDLYAEQVTLLPSGNVVATHPLNDFGAADAGAVYVFNPADGTLLSALVGTQAGDLVGSGGVTILNNGNFVVSSPDWANGGAPSAGAVTFGLGTAGVNGTVSGSNSLVGSTANDRVGSNGITPLLITNNYVVSSPEWNNAVTGAAQAGAVTWGSGLTGVTGAVSSGNSLVGTSAGDQLSSPRAGAITELPGGDYVVRSPLWNNVGAPQAGAVTWGSGTTGVKGDLTDLNSLVGSHAGDFVGQNGIEILANGNYVVRSNPWNAQRGAVTWGSGTAGVRGVVTDGNSLVGDVANDRVGSGGVLALFDGSNNYVVNSPEWNNGAATQAGAVTWGSGTTGVSGLITPTNSLVGATTNDRVGSGGVLPLANGNYLVHSPDWSNAGAASAGAVTWRPSAGGVNGPVLPGNSLVGSRANDRIGAVDPLTGTACADCITLLPNGNYVVRSPDWDNGAGAVDAGAATFGLGNAGVSGAVGAGNSLVGSTTGDHVGMDSNGGGAGIAVLANNNYVIRSERWDNTSTVPDAGAATWGSGTAGVMGAITSGNSLVGLAVQDFVSSGGVVALINPNGNYVVSSPNWANGAAGDAGAATLRSGSGGSNGAITPLNSLVGTTAGDQVSGTGVPGRPGVTALTNGNYVVSSPFWNNGPGIAQAGAVTWGDGSSATGVVGPVSGSVNSLVGGTPFVQVGSGGITELALNGNYVVSSPQWSNGGPASLGAVTWGSGTAALIGTVSDTNSLVGSTANDRVGNGGFTLLPNGAYLVSSPNWINAGAASSGAVTWGGPTGVSGIVSAGNSLVGSTANDRVGDFGTINVLPNGNYVVRSVLWDNAGAVDAGAVSFGTAATGVRGAISATNSLVGTTANDNVGLGSGDITVLPNGNFVVTSGNWNGNRGAVTWVSGTSGITGAVSATNSYVGATSGDSVGAFVLPIPLANGNFIVNAPDYDNGAVDSGRLVVYAPGAVFANPLLFADHTGLNVTITPAQLTAITDLGTAVVLQANNDITLAGGANIITNEGGSGGSITMQAGRSIVLNSSIFSDNGNVTLTANETVANGVRAGDRDAGTAALTMAPGTTIDAGTGDVSLRMHSGDGHAGTSGNITVANVIGANVSILNDGATAGSSIVRADAASLLTGSTSVHLELENLAGALSNASIGTSGARIRIDTPIVEAHYHKATGGIFIDSPNARALQVGGSPVFGGNVKGVQTPSGGPIVLTVNGPLTQQGGGAVCGALGGVGGPICAGPDAGAASGLGIANTVTLRAIDMNLGAQVRGREVTLLPAAGGTIALVANPAGAVGLHLNQSEIDLVDAGLLRIGENASGNVTFIDPSGTFTADPLVVPGGAGLEIRTGGTITSGNAASDIVTTNGNLTLFAGTIGASGAGRVRYDIGSGFLSTDSFANGTFVEQSVGDLNTSRVGFNLNGNPTLEYATTDGHINASGFVATGGGNISLIAGGTAKDVLFSGTGTITAASFTLAPTGSTRFTSGAQNFNAPVFTNRPVVVEGGTFNFNNATTFQPGATLSITSGVANFNFGTTIANAVTLAGGTLGGAGNVTLDAPFTWSGGTATGSGLLVTTANALTTLSGAATKTLAGKTWNNFGDVDWIDAGSILLADAAATINNKPGATWNILTTTQVTDMTGPGTFTNEAGATVVANAFFDRGLSSNSIHPATVNHAGTLHLLQGDIDYDNASTVNFSGPIIFENGTRIKSYNGPGTTLNFNVGATIAVVGSAVLEMDAFAMNVNAPLTLPAGLRLVQTGPTLTANAPLTFANGALYDLAGGTLQATAPVTVGDVLNFTGGTIAGTGGVTVLGSTNVPAGTPRIAGSLVTNALNATGGTLNVDIGGVLSLTGTGASTLSGAALANAGTLRMSGVNGLALDSGALLDNTGTIDLQSNSGFAHVAGAPAVLTNAGVLMKSAGGGTSVIGPGITVANTPSGRIDIQNGRLEMSASFPVNEGVINVGPGTVFATNGAGLLNLGMVSGNGTIDLGGGTLFNDGTVAPGASPGMLVIDGNYVQSPAGALAVQIGGPTPGADYDVLQVLGTADLAGTLGVDVINGYAPPTGTHMEFMSYSSHSGDFSAFVFPPGVALQPVPGPSVYAIAFGAGAGSPPASNLPRGAEVEAQRLNDRFIDNVTLRSAETDQARIGGAGTCN